MARIVFENIEDRDNYFDKLITQNIIEEHAKDYGLTLEESKESLIEMYLSYYPEKYIMWDKYQELLKEEEI